MLILFGFKISKQILYLWKLIHLNNGEKCYSKDLNSSKYIKKNHLFKEAPYANIQLYNGILSYRS